MSTHSTQIDRAQACTTLLIVALSANATRFWPANDLETLRFTRYHDRTGARLTFPHRDIDYLNVLLSFPKPKSPHYRYIDDSDANYRFFIMVWNRRREALSAVSLKQHLHAFFNVGA